MFHVLPETDGAFVAVEAIGKLTDADYTALIPELESRIAEHGPLTLFIDLSAFEGWEWQAAYDDLAFGVKHWNDIERMAMVGDARWEQISAVVMDKLSKAEVRFFPVAQRDEALAWARED